MDLKNFEERLNTKYGKKLAAEIMLMVRDPKSSMVSDWCKKFVKSASEETLKDILLDLALFLSEIIS